MSFVSDFFLATCKKKHEKTFLAQLHGIRIILTFFKINQKIRDRGGSRTAATSKMKYFVIIVNR